MIRGLYTSASGMITQMRNMDVISNNLANVNTTGFKKDGVVAKSFPEELTKHLDPQNKIFSQTSTIGKMSLGVSATEIYTDFKQGIAQQTNNPLDMMIEGPGYFAVQVRKPDGTAQEMYTKDGTFTINQEGFLSTKNGELVLGNNNNPISLGNANEIQITTSGMIQQNGEAIGQLKVVNFVDERTLKKVGDNLLEATEASQVDPQATSNILQGFLEGSNVNTVQEMVDMITVMRAYEANSKAVKTHDELLSKAVNEVGRIG